MKVPFGFFKSVVVSPSYDADALAYFARVTAAGGSLTTPEKNAVNQLVLDMKTANIWTLQKAIYPMKGSTAASCAQNLKSASFTGTFYGGWTFISSGALPNGTNAYMDTGFNDSTNLTNSNAHLSFYANGGIFNGFTSSIGITQSGFSLYITSGVTYGLCFDWDYQGCEFVNKGFFCTSRTSSASRTTYYNGGPCFVSTDPNLTPTSNANVYIGAANNYGSAGAFAALQCGFSSIGLGFTNAQATAFYNAVQTMQTSLGIQV
jgi:hypothetical protein